MAIPGGGLRAPSLKRHPSFPVPRPEVGRTTPTRRPPRPTGVFAQPLVPAPLAPRQPRITSPLRNLRRPAPVRRNERKLPPAPMPKYPVLLDRKGRPNYTPAQQRAVVRGIQRAGGRVDDRGGIRQHDLMPLTAVRMQQERAANRDYARKFGVSEQQAATNRNELRFRSHAEAKVPRAPSFTQRLVHALLTGDTGGYDPSRDPAVSPQAWLTQQAKRGGRAALETAFQPAPTPYDPTPKHIPYSGPLGLGTLSAALSYDANRNSRVGGDFGRYLQQALRHESAQQRSGTGGRAVTPAALRLPYAEVLGALGGVAPLASRLLAGAGNDAGQYVLGAIPSVATLGAQALKDPRGAANTLVSSTSDILKHPLDHPLFAAQILHGGVRAVSRTGGAVGRSGILGSRVKSGLNTTRAPLQIGGPAATKLLEYRHYSRDPLVMALQKAADKRMERGTSVVDQHGRLVQALRPSEAVVGRGIRKTTDALLQSSFGSDAAGRLRRFGDFTADRANAVERHNRHVIMRELVKMMPTRAHRGSFTFRGNRYAPGQAVGGYIDRVLHSQPGGRVRLPARMYRPERDVIGLVIRGVVKSRDVKGFRAELEGELKRLQDRAKESFDHPAQRELNRQNQRSIEAVLKDPRAMHPDNIARVVDAGNQLAAKSQQLTREAVRQGALNPDAAARAPLFDYAMRHMGARYFHENDHAALEREHLHVEGIAKSIVQEAHRSVREAEKAIADFDKANAPHLYSAPQGNNFMDRPGLRNQLEQMDTAHADLLRQLNAAGRESDAAREQLQAMPAGPAKEEFRAKVFRPLSDAHEKLFIEANRHGNAMSQIRERLQRADTGELITGQPERPVHEITWMHGTPEAYHDLPTAYQQTNDLGPYLTSDPHYASGYGEHNITNVGDAPGVQLVHVNPRKVLETRFGRVNPDEMVKVIEKVLQRADEIQTELHKALHEQVDRMIQGSKEKGTRLGRDPQHAAGFRESHVRQGGNVIQPHTRETLERWLKLLRSDKKTRDMVSGKAPLAEAIDDGSLAGWQEFDRTLMRVAPSEMTSAADRMRMARGDRSHGGAWGTHHQPTRQALRELGYDAVRKIDQHADSLVVLNESIMRGQGEPRPAPGKGRASVQLGSHLEAQLFERNARQHNVHVVSTVRKGDGIVAHVEGDTAAIDKLAAQHAHTTDSNVLRHAYNERGKHFVYEVRQGDRVQHFFDSSGDEAFAEHLRAAYPNAEITGTPGDARILKPEDHAQAVRDIRTAGNQERDQLTNRLEQARSHLAAARRAHSHARAERIAVSGRHPEQLARHEEAVARAAAARKRFKDAEAAHARAVQAHDRAYGATGGGFHDRRAMAHGERPTGKHVTTTDRQLRTAHETEVKHLLEQRRAARKAWRDTQEAVPAKPPINAGMRTAEGKLLTNKEILDHMRENGVATDQHGRPLVGFLPDRPDTSTRGNYHRAQALLKRDSVESGYNRTGAAQQMGIQGQTFQHVADHLVRMAISTGDGAIGQFDRMVREVGVVDKDGKPFDGPGAERALQNANNLPGQPKLTAIRMFPGRFSPGQRELIQRIQSPEAFDPTHYGGDFANYVERSFAERVLNADQISKSGGTRNIALVPEELVKRYQAHVNALTSRSPTGALLAKGFRTAVLPFSAKWLVGNVAEAVLRLAVIGANPFDYVAGRRTVTAMRGRQAGTPLRKGGTDVLGHRVLNEMIGLDAQQGFHGSTEVGSSLLGGLLYGEPGLTIHRGVSDYEHTNMRVPAQVMGGLAHTTLLREFGHVLLALPRGIFGLNRILERQAQYVALGRYVRRDIQEFSNSAMQAWRLQRTAINEAARGLYNTPAQHDAARFMDETLGKYSRFSPRLRATIQTLTPFLPWYLNAARFVFWTMPMKHPTQTAVLVAAEHAFSQDWKDQHKDLPPGDLKAAVKSKGGWLDLARFTPWGAFTGLAGGDPRQLTTPFFPQAQGIWHALEGKDPFGRDLAVPKSPDNPQGKASQGDIYKTALDQFLGSFLPYYGSAERIASHGETPYSGRNSLLFGIHTKPGTTHGPTSDTATHSGGLLAGLERTTNPFRPVYLRAQAPSGGKPTGMSTASYKRALERATRVAHQQSANGGAQARALARALAAAGNP